MKWKKEDTWFLGFWLIVVAGLVGSYFVFAAERNREIDLASYRSVSWWLESQPEMLPLVRQANSDGKISRGEYRSLLQESMEITQRRNNLKTGELNDLKAKLPR